MSERFINLMVQRIPQNQMVTINLRYVQRMEITDDGGTLIFLNDGSSLKADHEMGELLTHFFEFAHISSLPSVDKKLEQLRAGATEQNKPKPF